MRPHIGQVWREKVDHDKKVCIIAVSENWQTVFVSGWTDEISPECSFYHYLEVFYELDPEYND